MSKKLAPFFGKSEKHHEALAEEHAHLAQAHKDIADAHEDDALAKHHRECAKCHAALSKAHSERAEHYRDLIDDDSEAEKVLSASDDLERVDVSELDPELEDMFKARE